MKANIDKTFEVAHPIEQVWEYLSNPNKIVSCVPGAQLTEQIDDKNYKGTVSLKLGPVSASYNGQITIEELDKANYKMMFTGKGTEARGQGSAGMVMDGVLSSLASGNTSVAYSMEVSVSGKLAQFGSRLIVDVSDQLANQFIQNFKDELAASAEAAGSAAPETASAAGSRAADKSVNVFALLWAVIKNAISRLFKKQSTQ